MRISCSSVVALLVVALVYLVAAPCPAAPPEDTHALTIVVMDPLAAPLACPCVKGHAQRRYEKLSEFLQQRLGRPVRVVFCEDLARAIQGEAKGQADLIIGKQSLVRFDAAECRLAIRPLAMLTGKDGSTTLTGLFVVPKDDPAKTLSDLKGYKLLFGPADSDEKHAAAVAALKTVGVAVPQPVLTRPGCSDAALDALEHKPPPGAAAVISSYAIALLEGCGTIEKGALRVVGQTAPVPFVTVFATRSVSEESSKQICEALLAVRQQPALLAALESKAGFVAMPEQGPAPGGANRAPAAWPGWRGPGRDGICPALPRTLPAAPKILWKRPLTGPALAGIAATTALLVVADRDPLDQLDIFRCLQADSGAELWQLSYPAFGKLDYGNSPRATPLIDDDRVYLLGAFGDLHCVGLADGRVRWKKQLIHQFGATPVKWGMCASPLIVGERLLVNPGAKDASLVALDRLSGKVLWRTGGPPAAYASLIFGPFGGRPQVVGYDAISLGGWDVETGARLWTLVAPERGDFNVPTPIAVDGKLLVATENNGTRLYGFDEHGKVIPRPLASFRDLAPDSSTPVVLGEKVFGCWRGELFCLDLRQGLKPRWVGKDDAFDDYCSFIAGGDRLLITTARGELLLVNAAASQYELLCRQRVFGKDGQVIAHPAVVGNRLYVRDAESICCVALEP